MDFVKHCVLVVNVDDTIWISHLKVSSRINQLQLSNLTSSFLHDTTMPDWYNMSCGTSTAASQLTLWHQMRWHMCCTV